MSRLSRSVPRSLVRWWRERTAGVAARSLPGVPGQVHCRDRMLYDESEASIELYLRAGRSALENLERCVGDCGRELSDVRACLDFGCGHGRVLRHLCRHIEPRRITACDVNAEAVRFCAREFGAVPLLSSWRPAELELGEYDLAWCGSVLTHLDRDDGEALLGKLGSSLLPGGVLVLTVHGQAVLDELERLYQGVYAAQAPSIRAEVAAQGVAFREYDPAEFGTFPVRYGMAWHAPGFLIDSVRRSCGEKLRLRSHRERGWDHHHDVLAFEHVGS